MFMYVIAAFPAAVIESVAKLPASFPYCNVEEEENNLLGKG